MADNLFYFPEGVLVKLPKVKELEGITVVPLNLEPFPDPDSNFTYSRKVIRIDFKFDANQKKKLKDLKHQFHIIVFFTQDDLDNVKNNVDDLILGIHDDTKWTPFKKPKWEKGKDQDAEKKKTSPWIGYAKIKIKDWKDPAAGWGP